MSFISSFHIAIIVLLCKAEDEGWSTDPKSFSCIPASACDAAVVNLNGIKMLPANGFITFFIGGNPVFSNGLRSLPRNPPYCIILDIWVFDNLIWVDDL